MILVSSGSSTAIDSSMFSHIVIWWTDPAKPEAADEMIAGANKYLKELPGVLFFHIGKMVATPRYCVDNSYQVAMTMVFPDKAAHDLYLKQPLHGEFVEKCFKRLCVRDLVYDYV